VGKICWLASYPKSGNTWLRVLLANYQSKGDAPVAINALGTQIGSARPLFDEWAGIEASALDADTVDNLLPEVYRCAARAEAGVAFLKVHNGFRRNMLGEPLFPPDVSVGAVYVVRNVMDVAVSLGYHGGYGVAGAVDRLCRRGYSTAHSRGKLDTQLRQVLGSWSEHAASWNDQTLMPVHLLRYEDMLRRPVEEFARVVRFCGLPFEEDRVRRAVLFSGFEELRRQEQAGGFRETPECASAPFFRRGQAGSGARELPADLADRLVETHGETLRRFGYRGEKYAAHTGIGGGTEFRVNEYAARCGSGDLESGAQ
jgi:aryl sulfotransferase